MDLSQLNRGTLWGDRTSKHTCHTLGKLHHHIKLHLDFLGQAVPRPAHARHFEIRPDDFDRPVRHRKTFRSEQCRLWAIHCHFQCHTFVTRIDAQRHLFDPNLLSTVIDSFAPLQHPLRVTILTKSRKPEILHWRTGRHLRLQCANTQKASNRTK